MVVNKEKMQVWIVFLIFSLFFLSFGRVEAQSTSNHFPFTPTNSSARFYGTLEVFGQGVSVGDEIGVFAEGVSVNSGCVGSRVIENEGLYFVDAFSDDLSTDSVKDGAVAGDSLTFKLWKASDNTVYNLQTVIAGKGVWTSIEPKEVNLTTPAGEIQASFTTNPVDGCAPLEVIFTNTSYGEIDSYHWDFGDGTTSDLENPTHIFEEAGSFEVALTIQTGSMTNTSTQEIHTSPAPIALFTPSALTGTEPLTVNFTNQSQGSVTSLVWNFGDGNSSTNQNPTHTYAEDRTYTVTLTITNACGSNQNEKTITVLPGNTSGTLKASFTINSTEGCSPFPVQFIDKSTGNPTNWLWTFGDGQSSTDPNPTHEYLSPGLYTIRLTVTNDDNEQSFFELPNLICGQAKPVADFESDRMVTCPGEPIQFADLSGGYPNHWVWNFGDESPIENVSDPEHVYDKPGVYTVRLTVYNTCGSSMKQKSAYIMVMSPPEVDFQTEQIGRCADQAIQFTDKSTNIEDTWLWDFGDGSTSTDRHPIHNFSQAGTYDVILTVENNCGSTTKTKKIEVQGPPTASFTTPVTFGSVGQEIQFTDHSTGTPNIWLWDFGDGCLSDQQNPKHSYLQPGKYPITIGAKNNCGSSIMRQNILIGMAGEAFFDLDTDSPCTNESVQFKNVSDPNFQTFVWNFGDGVSSNEQEPIHHFQTAGTFQITLTASNSHSSHTYQKTITVQSTPFFMVDTVNGCAPLTIQCHDLSTTASEWHWDLGDGTTSTEQHPTHTYLNAGNYTINLIYDNACGSAQQAGTTLTVRVQDALAANFTNSRSHGPAPFSVSFSNQSIGTQTCTWDFGDHSGLSTQTNPEHVYTHPGLYEVSLSVANENCTSTKSLKGIDVYLAGSIKGRVISAQTGQALSEATIQILGHEGQEHLHNGEYLFENLRSGLYALKISAPNYETGIIQNIRVRSNEVTSLDLPLNPGIGSISGKVVDLNSNPVSGAIVTALAEGNSPAYACQAQTNQQGIFTIYLGRSGNFTLLVSADGYSPKIDDHQGAGYVIQQGQGSNTITGCHLVLQTSPSLNQVKVFSSEIDPSSGSPAERQTKIMVYPPSNFTGSVEADFDPEIMGNQPEGHLGSVQLIESNPSYYEIIYSGYTDKEVQKVGLIIQLISNQTTLNIPYIFEVTSSTSTGSYGLCLKGIGTRFTPAGGGICSELGTIDLDKDGTSDVYDKSFVQIPASCMINQPGAKDFQLSPLMVRLDRIFDPSLTSAAAIYDLDLLTVTGEQVDNLQINPNNPIIVHLSCDPASLGFTTGNLVIKYLDENDVWKEDGLANVHLADDLLVFTVTHLTRFALFNTNSKPSNLVVQSPNKTQLDLAWVEHSENKLGFEVWRCTNADPSKLKNYTLLTIVDPETTSYSDTSCQFDNIYNYMIRAITETGNTDYSEPGGLGLYECDFVPETPQELRIDSVSIESVTITWDDPSSCESGFEIYRKSGPNGEFSLIHSVASGVTTYTDTDLKAKFTYYYLIKATSNIGNSEDSNILEVTTPGTTSSRNSSSNNACFLSCIKSSGASFKQWFKRNLKLNSW